MIRKILLIRPPVTFPIGLHNFGVGEPLGILYIAANLQKHSFDVSVYDAANVDSQRVCGKYITYGASVRDIKEAIKRASPDLVGISCFTSCSEFDLFESCKAVKGVASEIPVVVGGSHPTLFPKRMLKRKYIDYVILQEGEHRLVSLVRALNGNEKDFDFDGIAYRQEGSIQVRPATAWIENIDGLSYPARQLVDMENYARINESLQATRPYKKGLILSIRGCFNSCGYCLVYKYWGQKMRVRSVENIAGEVRLLKDSWGIEEFFLVDDNLNCGRKFMKELLAALRKLNIRLQVPLGLYPSLLDKDILQMMRDVNMNNIVLSIDSASKRVLSEVMHRALNVDGIQNIVEEAHKLNMKVAGSFVVGVIGEKRDELMETLDFPRKIGLDSARFNIACPLPGTEFYNLVKARGYLPKDFTFRDAVIWNSSELDIPEDSPDFVMPREELRGLIAEKERELEISMVSAMDVENCDADR